MGTPTVLMLVHLALRQQPPLLDASKNITNFHRFPGVIGGIICALVQ